MCICFDFAYLLFEFPDFEWIRHCRCLPARFFPFHSSFDFLFTLPATSFRQSIAFVFQLPSPHFKFKPNQLLHHHIITSYPNQNPSPKQPLPTPKTPYLETKKTSPWTSIQSPPPYHFTYPSHREEPKLCSTSKLHNQTRNQPHQSTSRPHPNQNPTINPSPAINDEQHQLFAQSMSRMSITSCIFQTDFLGAMLYVVFLVVWVWKIRCQSDSFHISSTKMMNNP